MTKGYAMQVLREMMPKFARCDKDVKILTAINMAIVALKQESCEDAVRRLIKDKINTLEDIASTANSEGRWVEDEKCCYTIEVLEGLVADLEALSPATPQEHILNKIRDEIEQLRLHKSEFLTNDGKVCIDSQEVLAIIDKYKTESEG